MRFVGLRSILLGTTVVIASSCSSGPAVSSPQQAGPAAQQVAAVMAPQQPAGIPAGIQVSDAELYAKVALWLELMRPDAAVGYEEAAAFIRQNPSWPGQTTLRRQVERLMPETLPADEVLRWFGDYPPLTAAGKMLHAEALLQAGETERAGTLLRRLWAEDGMPDALEAQFLERYGGFLTPADELARLDRLLWDRSAAARRQAQRLGPDYVLLAAARLALAGGGAAAINTLARVPAALQDDPGLLYERANWHRRQDDPAGAIALLDRPETATRPDRWWPLRHWAARRALDDGDPATAYRVASLHLMQEGAAFAEAEWLAGWIALRFLDRPDLAWSHFDRFAAAVSTPVSESRGAYWAGRAAEALGNRQRAEQRYAAAAQFPTTFYGQLAAARLGLPVRAEAETSSDPTPAERTAFARRELVRAVGILGELGERRWADLFLIELGKSAETPAEGRMVAELALEKGRPGQAVAIARTLRTRGIVLPGHLFPVLSVKPVASEDPALVLAVIRQESSFNPEAVSSAGALGLMQLMPGTAREVAGKLGLSYRQASLTAEPEYNMLLGQTYLSQLIDRFDGSALLAVAGYNAGPGNVRRWLDRYGDPRDGSIDVIDWIERIPLAETRNYVQRVFEGLHVYRQRLHPNGAPASLSPELKPQIAAAVR